MFVALLALAAPAAAAQRTFTITSFDRLRVDGAFDVRLEVGAQTRGIVEGDADALDAVDLDVQGTTLIIRRNRNGAAERGSGGPATPLVVRVAAPTLRTATVIGGGKLAISGIVRGQRIDLQVTGPGKIDAQAVDADELNVTVLGAGEVAVGGRARRARLLTSGSGTITATALTTNDLAVRLDGPGETSATARYTANLTSTGLGRITVAGSPACITNAVAGGPISCGNVIAP